MLIPRKSTSFEEISLIPIKQTDYILNIDGANNGEEIFSHWKRGMNSVLNLKKYYMDCSKLPKIHRT